MKNRKPRPDGIVSHSSANSVNREIGAEKKDTIMKQKEAPFVRTSSWPECYAPVIGDPDRTGLDGPMLEALAKLQGYRCAVSNLPLAVPEERILPNIDWQQVLQNLDPDNAPALVPVTQGKWVAGNIVFVRACYSRLVRDGGSLEDVRGVCWDTAGAKPAVPTREDICWASLPYRNPRYAGLWLEEQGLSHLLEERGIPSSTPSNSTGY